MAQRPTGSGGAVAGDPKKRLRRKMAQTRAALADDLGQLKSRLLGIPGARPKGKKRTMTTKKATAKSSSSSKTSPKKSRSNHSHSATRSATKVASKVVAKTKEVLGEMLAGAATGAVKGAAQAVLPQAEQASESNPAECDGHAEDKGKSRRHKKKSEK